MSNYNLSKIAFIFPGQGSQMLEMGFDMCMSEPDSKNAFNIVGRTCDFDLAKLCWNGPIESLNRTYYTQSAILAVSAACLQAVRRYLPINPLCVAGHSLGELTAIWAAEVLPLEDIANLTAKRAYLMENAPEGAMSAIIGLDEQTLSSICKEKNVVIANYNTDAQYIISGSKNNIIETENALKDLQMKVRIIRLSVGGAFHSPLMEEANIQFEKEINKYNFQKPICPIVHNIDGKACQEPENIKSNLKKQMTSSVKWTQTIKTMLELGTEIFLEIGAGNVLSGLIKKIDKTAKVFCIGDKTSLDAALRELAM